MQAIQEHTRQIHEARIANKQQSVSRGFRHAGKQVSNISSTYSSNIDGFVKTARMKGHNADMGKGIWSLSSRTTQKPYQRNLADTYPRNEFTMMPMQPNAPKYYDGKFLAYDHNDKIQVASGDNFEGRPVVFKPQAIERVQSKKKYGMNLKGVSAVPLHLCNDVTSELFQRSLDPKYKTEKQFSQVSRWKKEKAGQMSFEIGNSDIFMPSKNQHQTSTLHPLNFGNATRHWVERAYPNVLSETTSTSGRISERRDSALTSLSDMRNGERVLKSGSIPSAPEWYSEFFPRQKVADALKFMGSPEHHKTKSKEFVLDFNTK